MKRSLVMIAVAVGSLFCSGLANEADAGGFRFSSNRGRRFSVGYSSGVRPVYVRPYYVSPYHVSPYCGYHYRAPFGYVSPVASGAPSSGYVPRYVSPYFRRPGFRINVGSFNHGIRARISNSKSFSGLSCCKKFT